MPSRILIVDDDAMVLEALSGMVAIRIDHVSVDTCISAIDGLARLAEAEYDAIVSDIKMPVMDGLAFMERVLTMRPSTPTLLMTGHGDRDLGVHALKSGAYAFIEKPIDRDYFIAWLKRAIQLRQLSRAVEQQNQMLERTVQERTAELERTNRELKETLERERESEHRFRELIDALPAAIYTTDVEGRITHYNQAAIEFSGRRPELGSDQWCVSWKLYRPDGTPLPHDQCPMAMALKQQEPIRGHEAVAERPDGTRVPFIPYPTPLRNASGEPIGAVNMLIDITERKQAEDALRESRAQTEAELADTKLLQGISAEMVHEENVETLYDKIMDAAVNIMRSDYASMQMLYPERGISGELRLLASRGFSPEAVKFWEWVRADSQCSCGMAMRTGQRAIVPDVEKCDFMSGTQDQTSYLQAGIYAAQSTPLLSRNGKLVGMISTHWRKTHQPSERDLRLLDILARQAADLLDRKRAEQERAELLACEREARREAEMLNEVARTLAAELDLETLVQKVTDAATELTGAKFGAFFYNVLNEQGEAYLLYTLSGAPREAFEKFGRPRNTPVFNPTFHGEGVVRSPDITQDPRYGTMSPHHGMPKGHLPVRSYLAIPVVSRSGEVIGGLFFGHPDPGVFTERSERIAVGLAAQAAIAMDNARLYGAAQKEIAQRKQTEDALRESRERLQAALTGSGAGTFRWNMQTNALDWDDNLDRLFGLPPGHTIRSLDNFIATVHPDERTGVIERCERCARDGADFDMAFRVLWPDGTVHWLDDKGKTFFDEAGRPLYMTGMCLDITERKRAEESSRQNRERFDLVAQASQVGFWFCDLPFDQLMWDSRVKEHFWLPPDADVTIGTFYERLHSEDRARTRQAIADSIANKTRYDIEYRAMSLDGREKWIRAIGRTFYDAAGQAKRFDGVTLDITERKRAQQLEADQKRTLELIARDAPLATVFESVVRMIEEQSASGMLASILLLDEDGIHLRHGAAPSLPEAYNRAIDGIAIGSRAGSCGTAAYRNQAVYVSDIADDPLWADYAALALSHNLRACWSTPMFSSAGRLLGTLAMYYPAVRKPNVDDLRLVDVATRAASIAIERKRAEEDIRRLLQEAERRAQELREKQAQLVQSAKLASIGELATGIAHEINNPLNNIGLYVGNTLDHLQRKRLDIEKMTRDLTVTLKQVDRATVIIDHLRNFARTAITPHIPVSINQAIRSALSLVQEPLRLQNVAVRVDVCSEDAQVMGNAIQLEQVLINVLTNARDAVEQASTKAITVRSVIRGSQIDITVQDSGAGIAADLQTRIFDPFFTTKDVGKGTGLGLSISYGIIQDHGGTLLVESPPGGGAVFRIQLPLLDH